MIKIVWRATPFMPGENLFSGRPPFRRLRVTSPNSGDSAAQRRYKGHSSHPSSFKYIDMARRKVTTSSRLQKELFRKRRVTLFSKANALRKWGADVYVVIRRHDYFYTYSSCSSKWPPSLKEIVS